MPLIKRSATGARGARLDRAPLRNRNARRDWFDKAAAAIGEPGPTRTSWQTGWTMWRAPRANFLRTTCGLTATMSIRSIEKKQL